MVRVAIGVVVGATESSVEIWTKRLVDDAHPNYHVVGEVLISGDHGIAIFVFEANPLGDARARVETIEILDGCDDGIGGIMWVDEHTQGQTGLIWRMLKDEDELNRLGGGRCNGTR